MSIAEIEGAFVVERGAQNSMDVFHPDYWMTIGKAAEYLGKTHDWTKPRLEKYKEISRQWPDSQGRLRTYYPIEAIDVLAAELRALMDYPVVDESDISINGLSLALDRDEKWVAARLPYFDIESTTKRNPVNNRLFEYYSREDDLPLLEAEDARMRAYPVAGDDESTVEGLATVLGVGVKWVRRRLRYIVLTPVVKLNPYNNQLYSYYPTEQTIAQMNELGDHFKKLKPRHPSERVDEIEEQPQRISRDDLTPNALNWGEFANCTETDPELFNNPNRATVRMAKQVCEQCVARLYCLDYAIATDQPDGVWGGKTAAERKRLKLLA